MGCYLLTYKKHLRLEPTLMEDVELVDSHQLLELYLEGYQSEAIVILLEELHTYV